MKESSRIIITMAAVLLTASCMKDPLPGFESGSGSSAIEINPVTRVLTKAPVVGTTFPSGRTIVVSAYNNVTSGTSKNHFSAAAFTKDGETWKGGKYWPSSGTLDILGYSADGLSVSAAYDSNVAAGVTLTVPDNSTAQTDILWGAVTGQTSGSPVSLGLHHALAALAFNAKSTDAYNEAANTGITVTGITVKSVKNSGTVYLKGDNTCTWSSLSTAKDISVPGLTDGYGVPSEEMTIGSTNPFGIGNTGLVVIPQTATSVTVTYTVHKGRDAGGNAVDETGVQGTATLSGSWAAGKKYICTLSFEAERELELSVSVVDWTDQNGSAELTATSSAIYSVSGESTVGLTATLDGMVEVIWGDGSTETKVSTGGDVRFSHTYASPYTGNIQFVVLKGTMTVMVPIAVYNNFTVNDSGKVTKNKVFAITVNDAGKQVIFSTGNLYWNGSKFAFESSQYAYQTSWSSSHVDKFFWSSDASIARASSYSDPSASISDKFFASDGGAVAGYTVLSKDEWDYLLAHSTTKYNVSVNSKKCLVLAPDGVSVTISSSYTSSAWNTAVTNYGLVALPMAGMRIGTSFSSGGSYGFYWSDTQDETAYDLAYNASFNSSISGQDTNNNRNEGYSVRLVKVISEGEEEESEIPDIVNYYYIDQIEIFDNVGPNYIEVPSWATLMDVFLVNGGNAGTAGTSSVKAGKGGAGGKTFSRSDIAVTAGELMTVTIGAGGTTSSVTGGLTSVTVDSGTYSPSDQPVNSQTSAGSNGTAAPEWYELNGSLYGAGGGAGTTSTTILNGGTTGGGKGGRARSSGTATNATAGTFYGAGGGGGAYYSGTKIGNAANGYQGIAIIRFRGESN